MLWKPDLNLLGRTSRHRATMRPRSGAPVSTRGRYRGDKMPYSILVLGAGAGFFLAMYQWVTMIAETLP